jgi:glutathione synthase/RimK-type ligase-like ATP-grasp enzyme
MAMNKNLIILTCYDGFFGQQVEAWQGFDLDKMSETFRSFGFSPRICSYHQLANTRIDIENSYIVYSGNPDREYYTYAEDVLLMLLKHGNILIPSFDINRCHENKGYQELYKRQVGIESPRTMYLGSIRELINYKLDFPLVFKLPFGAASRHVKLIGSKKKLTRHIKSCDTLWRNYLKRYFKERIKKYILPWRYVREYDEYFLKQDVRHILQRFIPNLTYDYKLLVFFDKYYVLKRFVRNGDFRASGSRIIRFEKPPDALLDYAEDVHRKLNLPIAGLDICFDGKKHHLLEFQGIHFGPITMVRSEGYYHRDENGWRFTEEKPDLEREYATAVVKYIRKKFGYEDSHHQ